ncbi:YdeI/OmpD-associated family protein [Enterococcus canis]|uniref:YdeI/OmpD-associated family protein n=1 Tax=Enterococcus canis TaxID=214095 RepID=UPI000835668B|nr:YdeI/OmpD-associated family protein [Enterococcus canis]
MFPALIKKLKLDRFEKPVLIKAPADYDVTGVAWTTAAQPDLLFTFIETLPELVPLLQQAQKQLPEAGVFYFAYPKKGNTRFDHFIGRDEIMPFLKVDEAGFIPETDLKFNRMVALDEDYTVIGLKKTTQRTSSAASQRVGDYAERIPELSQQLPADIRPKFTELTPGYQKNWARFVYSAKTAETQAKRLDQMTEALSQGYKSIDLLRKAKADKL